MTNKFEDPGLQLEFPLCIHCSVRVAPFHFFCVACGNTNAGFRLSAFAEKYRTTLYKMREKCTTTHAALIKLIGIEILRELPFCEHCGADLTKAPAIQ